MMTLAELGLIREFVAAALAAGLIRTIEGAEGAASIGRVLARETALAEAEQKTLQEPVNDFPLRRQKLNPMPCNVAMDRLADDGGPTCSGSDYTYPRL